MSHGLIAPAYLALGFIAALGAADAAVEVENPWGRLVIGSGNRLVQRWNASAYARWYAHPALTGMRAEIDRALAEAEAEIGFPPLAALIASNGIEARFLGMDAGQKPRGVVQVDLGLFAAPAFALLKTRIATAWSARGSTITDENVAGADEAFSFEDGERAIVARFGPSVVVAINLDAVPAPRPITVDDADVVVTVDGSAIADGMAGAGGPLMTPVALSGMMRLYGGDAVHRLWLVPEGIRLRSEQKGYSGLMVPAERALLTRLDAATTAYAAVIGLDGAMIWDAAREGLLPMMGLDGDADAMEDQLDQQLAAAGFDTTVAELATGFTGSCVLALSQAEPYPALLLAVPRSPALDRLLTLALEQQGMQAPEEGANTPLPLGFTQGALGRDLSHWIVASDDEPVVAWMTKRATGWSDNPAGRLALSQATALAKADATAIAGLDLALAVRIATPLISEHILAKLPADERAPWDGLLADLAAEVGPDSSISWDEDEVQITEYRGLVGGITGLYFGAIAGWMIPIGMQAHDAAAMAQPDLPAAAQVLKFQLFPAQVQFQGGAYCDQDHDNVGEYGFLSELAGRRGMPAYPEIQLNLVPDDLADAEHEGWRYAIHLPDADGLTVREPALAGPRAVDADAAERQELSWLAYAWPSVAAPDAMMYAIDQSGQVYAQPYPGEPPAWNGLFGDGGTWGDEATWPVLQETQILEPEVQQAIDQAVIEAEGDEVMDAEPVEPAQPDDQVDPAAVP